jgi:hypothetical protein
MRKDNRTTSVIDVAVFVAGLEEIPEPSKKNKTEAETFCLDAAIMTYKEAGLTDGDVARLIPGVNFQRIWRAKQEDRERLRESKFYNILRTRLKNHLK